MPFDLEGSGESLFLKEVCHQEASISYFQSVGDFNHLGSRLNVPAIIFGAEGENIHADNEYATISSIVKTADIIYDFLLKVLAIKDIPVFLRSLNSYR